MRELQEIARESDRSWRKFDMQVAGRGKRLRHLIVGGSCLLLGLACLLAALFVPVRLSLIFLVLGLVFLIVWLRDWTIGGSILKSRTLLKKRADGH
ncbi:MAG: hypothetical protein SYC29_13540 [Planctomycetota bacterium]|jgi:Flp pilus assembly protein TadB|nr:hypothetical protein [Planctomycetota bacterium]